MNFKKIIKTAIKYGPIIYPIIKKFIDSQSTTKATPTRRTPSK